MRAAPIVAVRWSPSRPSAFFAADGDGSLHVFDLLAADASRPAETARLGLRAVRAVRVVAAKKGRWRQFVAAVGDGEARVREVARRFTEAGEGDAARTEAALRGMHRGGA